MMPLSVMLIGMTLLGAASAARSEPNAAASLEGRVSRLSHVRGVAEHAQVTVAEGPGALAGFRLSPGVLRNTTPACAAAFSALNADAAYTQAINAVYDDARAIEPEAAKDCEAHLMPSYDPFGGWCKARGVVENTHSTKARLPVPFRVDAHADRRTRFAVEYFRPLCCTRRSVYPPDFIGFSSIQRRSSRCS